VTPAPEQPSPLVGIENVSIRLRGHTTLDGVSIAIERGHLHVIVGPNGAGKSSLVKAMLGQLPFDGRIVMHWRRTGVIGYVPQSFAIDPTLPVTVEDFLALTRQRRPISLGIGRATRTRIADLLERVGMQGYERRPLAGLSGGELRRVLLTHALDPAPELLILDEPGSGLDERSGLWLEATLSSLRSSRDTTIVMVSHDREQTRRIADHVTLLDHRLVADGRPADVMDGAGDRAVHARAGVEAR
jgi:zinc transport system ATP-binding protein